MLCQYFGFSEACWANPDTMGGCAGRGDYCFVAPTREEARGNMYESMRVVKRISRAPRTTTKVRRPAINKQRGE